ncbi:MAG: SusF/SusE family outer membrane protein [Bacteroidales bacterium]|jgi:hypothetical protein|nr:SusF/SusE family outer membrane protein [Bacteroidales bacterium]
MKKNHLRKLLYLMGVLLLASMVMIACKKDDPDPDPTPQVEDGIYIKGAGTALVEFDLKGLMKPTLNENGQEERAELLELFVAVKGGSEGFNIVKVAGTTHTVYGPGADFAQITEDEWDTSNEYPRTSRFWRGLIAETDAKFTIPNDGLYQVVYDTELGVVVIVEAKWGMIGAATPGGWSDDTEMTTSFDLQKMEFKVVDIPLLKNDWKFRIGNGWKVWMNEDGSVRVNTNLGGSVSAPTPGGDDFVNDEYALYTVTLNWELGKPFAGDIVKTGEGEPLPEYPEEMFLVGSATAYGWDTPGTYEDALMHPLAGGAPSEGIFWKIAHLEGGEGFKLSDEGWGAVNLGYNEIDEFDAEGVEVGEDGGNMKVAESGMYIIVLNLRDDQIKVSVKPAEVYGIGDAFGGWDAAVPANKFTIDNNAKTLVSPPLAATANIRMYAEHNWIPDWWNAEFNVFNGEILYRNAGGDQEAVPGEAGQVITLHFDDNTGSID